MIRVSRADRPNGTPFFYYCDRRDVMDMIVRHQAFHLLESVPDGRGGLKQVRIPTDAWVCEWQDGNDSFDWDEKKPIEKIPIVPLRV